jgi:hypothetical protein
LFDTVYVIPSFCIGETFAVFEKYRWGATWNTHVGNSKLTPAKFRQARTAFHGAIHNGTRLLQVELNRYHILCLDLIAPINAAYKIKRDRKPKGAKKAKRKNVTPASTYDLLLIAIGIWMQKQLGAEHFVIATGDERVALVLKRARSASIGLAMRRHLSTVAQQVGLNYGPDIYPKVVDLAHATKTELEVVLPQWTPAW